MQRCEFNKRFLELRAKYLNRDFFVVITDHYGNKVRIKIEPTDTANGILNFYHTETGNYVYTIKSINPSSKKPGYTKSPSLRGFFNQTSKNFEKIFAINTLQNSMTSKKFFKNNIGKVFGKN